MTAMMTDKQWEEEREAAAQRFLGITAEEFARKIEAEEFTDDETDKVMRVLMLFPELD